jgi:hypothetical protein
MNVVEGFWIWFVQHEAEMFYFDAHREAERDRLFGRLAAELRKVSPDLTFEFGPRGQTREFIISAGGTRDAFPVVTGLAGAARI